MVLSKEAGQPPRAIAGLFQERLRGLPGVGAVEIAGPGFINLRLDDRFWLDRLAELLRAGTAYGDSTMGQGRPVNVEYVSANPTGPMHVGHARGAVFGDALASVLAKAGFAVTREYYINDAGGQVEALAASVHARYLVLRGAMSEAEFAECLAAKLIQYGGEYLIPVAEALAARDGDRWVEAAREEWLPAIRAFAIEWMMALVREDLAALGVSFDVFTSERALVERGAVEAAEEELRAMDLLYVGVLERPKGKVLDDWEERPQTLFRASEFGDDVDRPLRKSDGAHTYFAADIAYHRDKLTRGFTDMINVWGADHGGYVKRMQAAVAALSRGKASLDVKLCQLVKLMDGGEPVKMSKRAGTFVTLREVVDEVGRDVVRFIMLTRKNDAPLEFDFQKVREQSSDNPVWYVQYAHARCRSVARQAAEMFPDADLSPDALAGAALDRLVEPGELSLIRRLASWPRAVEQAADAHEPHRLAYFLNEIAQSFHALWNTGKGDTTLRFLVAGDVTLSMARLALVRGVQTVIASGLAVFGVEPVEEM